MHLEAWDSVFIRARRADVHAVLRDLTGYGHWWPGVSAVAAAGGARLRFAPPQRLHRAHAVTATVEKDRPGLGLNLTYAGDLTGAAEWYYLDEPTGVVVHYLLRAATTDRGWRRLLADHRATVRRGLNELKDRLEAGRIPGSEPDQQLLRDQQAAIAEFRAGVQAHRRTMAALAEAEAARRATGVSEAG
jgi:hypothetical protein